MTTIIRNGQPAVTITIPPNPPVVLTTEPPDIHGTSPQDTVVFVASTGTRLTKH